MVSRLKIEFYDYSVTFFRNLTLRGLAEIVEICRTVDTDIVYPHMTTINQRIIDMLKSSRSHVCRTTCNAVGHLFEYVKDTRRPVGYLSNPKILYVMFYLPEVKL